MAYSFESFFCQHLNQHLGNLLKITMVARVNTQQMNWTDERGGKIDEGGGFLLPSPIKLVTGAEKLEMKHAYMSGGQKSFNN